MNCCMICGNLVDVSDRYCSQCGSCLSPSTQVAEYRFITILCTDLSGYSLLSERLDHEELQELMGSVLSEITRIIIRFGGTIEKYIGDAVVAIYGNSKAREDDLLRAILSARDIHRTVEGLNVLMPRSCNIHMSMHTGINTGEVLMDSGTTRHSSHGTLGKPINIASRLCDIASRGEIFIGESLISEAMRYFHLEWMGRKMLKGFRTPIHVYKVMDERKIPLAVHRSGGVTSPLVGREHELSELLSRARKLQSGQGGVLSIIGDAGVGKSRLIEEFKALLNDGVAFVTATCHDHASSTPYFPFTKLISSILGISETDNTYKSISQALIQYGLPTEHATHLTFFRDQAFSLRSESPDTLKEQISDAFVWLLSSKALARPTIICIEDIHWADQSTLDLLAYLIHNWKKSWPCLLVLSHRPGSMPALSSSFISLRELSESEVGRMLTLMFEALAVPEPAVHSLTDATGGNPFFIEELANYLLEKGADLVGHCLTGFLNDVPTTLYGLISSRLDHMEPIAKKMLQEAALIGRGFSEDLLALVCSNPDSLKEGLIESVKHGFIHPTGEGEYIFKHDMTRDVAGRTLLKRERVRLHKKIALALEDRAGSCPGDHAGELAHHYAEAQNYIKAVYYHMEAGKRCQSTGAWVEAGWHFSSAERCVLAAPAFPEVEEKVVEIQEGIWRCCRVFNPARAITALEALADNYRLKGLKEKEAFCSIRLINLYSQIGLFEKAKGYYTHALSIIGNDPVLIAAAHTAIAYTYTFLGKQNDALRLLDSSRPSLEASDRFLFTVNTLTTLAACVWKGDMKSARTWYDRTKVFSGAYMDIDLMADIWLAHICCLEGDFDEARRVLGEVSSREKKLGKLAGGLSYLRIQGSIYFRSRYFGDIRGARYDLHVFNALGADIHNSGSLKDLYRAWIALEEGKPQETKDLIHAALPGLREGIANRVPYALNALAEANLLLNDLSAARQIAEESITWNEHCGNADQLIWGLRIFAEICISQGEYITARKALSRAYSLARACKMKPHQAWIIALWGNLLNRTGKHAESAICLGKSLKLWKEMGNPIQVKRVAKELNRTGYA